MEPFATVEDYEARYGLPKDASRLSALLEDASVLIARQPGFSMPADGLGLADLRRVTCAVVNRALSAGDWAGMSSVSQGADGYTATVSLANPAGDLYLTAAEKRTLGVGGGRIGATDPYGEVG